MKLYSQLLPGNVCLHRMTVKYVIVETVSDVIPTWNVLESDHINMFVEFYV